MADTWTIKTEGFVELAADLRAVEKAFPNIAFKYIRKAGNAVKRDAKKRSDSRTKKRTGNLSRGYRNDVDLQPGSFRSFKAEIRGGAGKAHHFHLLENGHEGWVPDRSGRLHYVGFVAGRNMMKDTKSEWADGQKFQVFANKALDEALKKGGF